jgi:hypothetical protein
VSLYPKFDAPAFLTDLSRVPGLSEEWSKALSLWFDSTVSAEKKQYRRNRVQSAVQYFNPVTSKPEGPVVEQAITWNAFPKELLRTMSKEQALVEADRLWPLTAYRGGPTDDTYNQPLYRPQVEYCEWRVLRDPLTGAIRKVTFVSEPPEYYQALFGGLVERYEFHGDPQVVLDLYHEHVSEQVRLKDLIAPKGIPYVSEGSYNPYNKWNTTHGIMHLGAPPNSLTAEIQLGGDASVVRKSARNRLLVESDALICAANYGGPDRNSDPTIGSTVNALARLGAMITLQNPVGLYMDHIDLAGWRAPDGGPLTDLLRIVRGRPGMIERLEVEVPAERGFSLSDVTIGGVPIRYGGQIAECITVKLTGVAILTNLTPVPLPCEAHAVIDPAFHQGLGRSVKTGGPIPSGTVIALLNQGEGAVVPPTPKVAAKATLSEPSDIAEVLTLRRRI